MSDESTGTQQQQQLPVTGRFCVIDRTIESSHKYPMALLFTTACTGYHAADSRSV
jgi:hypothetical protein